MSDFGPGTTLK